MSDWNFHFEACKNQIIILTLTSSVRRENSSPHYSAPGVARDREKARGDKSSESSTSGRAGRGEGEINLQKRDPEKESV